MIFKAVAKKTDDRYLDMGAFAAALESLAAAVPVAKRGTTMTVPVTAAQPAEPIIPPKLTFGQKVKKIYKENSTCVILVIIALVVLSCLCVILGSIQQNKDRKNAAATEVAETMIPPSKTIIPPAQTSFPTRTEVIEAGKETPLPPTPRVKTCNLVPGAPLLEAQFPEGSDKFSKDPANSYFYFTQKLGKFEPTQNGVRLTSGAESAAVVALKANQPGSVLAVRSLNEGDFTILLVDDDALKNPEVENKDAMRLAIQVENKADNNASVFYTENGEAKGIASFQYPMRRETVVTIDLASHKLTVQDAQGDVIFSTGLPESINSTGSYWVIGDPAADNQGSTRLLLRGICYQDAPAK